MILSAIPVYAGSDFPDGGLFPPGFRVFCYYNPKECDPVEHAKPLKMSEWRETLDRVNREVNTSITYTIDQMDSWNVGVTHGDCDDYTVTKRQQLIEAGVPRGAMRAAYVLTIDDITHVFLVVSTDEGEMVLDNTTDEITPLNRYMLKRLSIQDALNPRQWWQIY